jgi:hypothetical protein
VRLRAMTNLRLRAGDGRRVVWFGESSTSLVCE